MKRLLVTVVACLSLVALQTNASVTIVMNPSGLLQDHDGVPIPADGNSQGLLVVDIGGFGPPTGTIPYNAGIDFGDTILGNYIVIARGDFTVPGETGGLLSLSIANLAYGGNITVGKQIDLLWFPGLAGTATKTPGFPSGQSWYGSFYGGLSGTGIPNNDDPWTIPNDGSMINIQMLTVHFEGTNPDSAGIASHPIGVPEPSTYLLVSAGLLGLLAFRRRS